MNSVLPKYPVYIPTKGRWKPGQALTARFLQRDGVPFYLVVEPQQLDIYKKHIPDAEYLTLDKNDQGLTYARNWIKDHSIAAGAERHWQLDDNMRNTYRWYKGRRIPVSAGIALRVCEDFSDRYENIAISGLNYEMFGTGSAAPFFINCRVYSCSLINNAIPHRWRLRYNDDTDICLQVLGDGWCTVLINAFLIKKTWTMQIKGGNTDDLYQGDGRLKMARSLERRWPGVVQTKRRFQRPQHVVKDSWKRFDTPLKLKPGINLADLPATNEYGMKIIQKDEVNGKRLLELKKEFNSKAE